MPEIKQNITAVVTKLTVVRVDILGEGHRDLLVGGHCPRYRSRACSLLLLLHSPVGVDDEKDEMEDN